MISGKLVIELMMINHIGLNTVVSSLQELGSVQVKTPDLMGHIAAHVKNPRAWLDDAVLGTSWEEQQLATAKYKIDQLESQCAELRNLLSSAKVSGAGASSTLPTKKSETDLQNSALPAPVHSESLLSSKLFQTVLPMVITNKLLSADGVETFSEIASMLRSECHRLQERSYSAVERARSITLKSAKTI